MIIYTVVYFDYIPIFIGFNNWKHTEHLPSVCSSLSHLVQWLTALLERGDFQQRRSDFMFSPPPSPPLHPAPVFPPSVQHLFFSLSTSFIILLSFWFTAALWSFIILLFHCRCLIFQSVYTAVEKTKLRLFSRLWFGSQKNVWTSEITHTYSDLLYLDHHLIHFHHKMEIRRDAL